MKGLYFLFFIFLLFSCTQQKIKSNKVFFYENGKIKEKRIYNSEIIDSIFKSTNLNYLKNKEEDSIILRYLSNSINTLKFLELYFEDSIYQVEMYDNGKVKAEGFLKSGLRVGKWKKYSNDSVINILEFKTIRRKSYVNQGWKINKNKDTIGGYFYTFLSKDTINLNETLKILIYLNNSCHNGKKSKIIVCISSSDTLGFNRDFSNSDEIEQDCSYDLETNKENKKFIYIDNYNKAAFIFKDFNSSGKNLVKGIIYEYLVKDKDSLGIESALENACRMYFEIPVFVKDSV